QDLWPEAFGFPLKLNETITNFLFKSMKKQEDYIFSSATHIVAVSDTYLKRGLNVHSTLKDGTVIYLGTDLKKFDEYSIKDSKKTDTITVVYAGTLGVSYDLYTVIDGIKKASKYHNIKFLVLGDGPLKEKFESYAYNAKIDVEFK